MDPKLQAIRESLDHIVSELTSLWQTTAPVDEPSQAKLHQYQDQLHEIDEMYCEARIVVEGAVPPGQVCMWLLCVSLRRRS